MRNILFYQGHAAQLLDVQPSTNVIGPKATDGLTNIALCPANIHEWLTVPVDSLWVAEIPEPYSLDSCCLGFIRRNYAWTD